MIVAGVVEFRVQPSIEFDCKDVVAGVAVLGFSEKAQGSAGQASGVVVG